MNHSRTPPCASSEYLRRNLLHCKAVGAHANTLAALKRASAVKRMPRWLIEALQGIEERIKPVAHEMALHRNEIKS